MKYAICIIQARLGSTRLPDKVLKPLCGKPMLEHIVDRVGRAKLVDDIIIATTTNPLDDELVAFVTDVLRRPVIRGSEHDVLARFIDAARQNPSEYIVRVTADDPLKDPDIIDQCLNELIKDPGLDYCSNTMRPTYPEGLDIEVFKTAVLERAHREATLLSEREHVTPYIWKHPNLFKLMNIEFERDLSKWRWTVDKPADFRLMEIIFDHFKTQGNNIPFREVIKYIEAHPELISLNNDTIRNEGYLKSIQGEGND